MCTKDGGGVLNIPIHARDRSWQRHANRGVSQIEVVRAVCEFWWTDLTTCDVSASLKAVVCQMHVKEMVRSLDSGLETRIRCDG